MKKIFLTVLALTTLTQSSWAILDEHKIDLKTAIEKALETNPQMQMLDMDVEISKNKIKEATRLQNPSIDVFQSMGSAIKTEPQTIGSSLLVEVMKRGKRKQVAKVQENIAI